MNIQEHIRSKYPEISYIKRLCIASDYCASAVEECRFLYKREYGVFPYNSNLKISINIILNVSCQLTKVQMSQTEVDKELEIDAWYLIFSNEDCKNKMIVFSEGA